MSAEQVLVFAEAIADDVRAVERRWLGRPATRANLDAVVLDLRARVLGRLREPDPLVAAIPGAGYMARTLHAELVAPGRARFVVHDPEEPNA